MLPVAGTVDCCIEACFRKIDGFRLRGRDRNMHIDCALSIFGLELAMFQWVNEPANAHELAWATDSHDDLIARLHFIMKNCFPEKLKPQRALIDHVAAIRLLEPRKRESRIKEVAQALFDAIHELGYITYTDDVNYDQHTGQAVRAPVDIERDQLATCLDIAVLYNACLLRIGLHPIHLQLHGDGECHAVAGCWLRTPPSDRPAILNGDSIRSMLDRHDLVLVDPTCALDTTRVDGAGIDVSAYGFLAASKAVDLEMQAHDIWFGIDIAKSLEDRPVPPDWGGSTAKSYPQAGTAVQKQLPHPTIDTIVQKVRTRIARRVLLPLLLIFLAGLAGMCESPVGQSLAIGSVLANLAGLLVFATMPRLREKVLNLA